MNLRTNTNTRMLVAGIAALAVVAGAGAAIAASTDTFDPKAERDAFQAAVADKLGVTTQQLENAYRAAALERLDAAVAAGRLTKEQADELRQRIESGEAGPMGGMFGPMGGMHGPGVRVFGGGLDAATDYLGLTEAQLHEKLAAGQSLADIAKAQGKSVDGLKSAMLAEAKDKLDQAVKDGKIAAAQRDEMLQHLEAELDDIVNGSGPSMRHGRGFGFRFGHGPPGFGDNDTSFPGQPDA